MTNDIIIDIPIETDEDNVARALAHFKSIGDRETKMTEKRCHELIKEYFDRHSS